MEKVALVLFLAIGHLEPLGGPKFVKVLRPSSSTAFRLAWEGQHNLPAGTRGAAQPLGWQGMGQHSFSAVMWEHHSLSAGMGGEHSLSACRGGGQHS